MKKHKKPDYPKNGTVKGKPGVSLLLEMNYLRR